MAKLFDVSLPFTPIKFKVLLKRAYGFPRETLLPAVQHSIPSTQHRACHSQYLEEIHIMSEWLERDFMDKLGLGFLKNKKEIVKKKHKKGKQIKLLITYALNRDTIKYLSSGLLTRNAGQDHLAIIYR